MPEELTPEKLKEIVDKCKGKKGWELLSCVIEEAKQYAK
jgi:transposase